MTLKSAFKAIGTDTTEPGSRTAFDHFAVHGRSLNPKMPNGSSAILPHSGCDRMRRDGHNRKSGPIRGQRFPSIAPRPSSFKAFRGGVTRQSLPVPRPAEPIILERRRLEHDGLICVAQNCAQQGRIGQTGSEVSS